ncbi:hypothetical protein ACVWZK_008085 [Bradyrhizobium sp. GM0.4]
MLGNPGNVGTHHHFAAERQHQPVISQRLVAASRDQRNLAPCRIDGFDLADPVTDADRIEQLRQRKRDLAEIGLVIADADVVVGIAIDDTDLDVTAGRADLLALACGTDGRPQTCKPGAEHDDTRHVR